jgi:hypothetical protein
MSHIKGSRVEHIILRIHPNITLPHLRLTNMQCKKGPKGPYYCVLMNYNAPNFKLGWHACQGENPSLILPIALMMKKIV